MSVRMPGRTRTEKDSTSMAVAVIGVVRMPFRHRSLFSLKMDGLTVLNTYENGELIQSETRGDGEEGELITHNAKVFDNLPLQINNTHRF